MEVRQREVVELQSQVKALGQEVKDTEEVDGRRQVVEKKFQELLDPLRRRRNFLVASREVHQFNRDVEDEIVRKTDPETDVEIRVRVGGLLLLGSEAAQTPAHVLMFCFPAVGPGEGGCGHIDRPRTQPTDCPAAYQEEPGERTQT